MEYVFYFKDKSNGVDIVQKQATCEWVQIPLEAIILFSRSVMVAHQLLVLSVGVRILSRELVT